MQIIDQNMQLSDHKNASHDQKLQVIYHKYASHKPKKVQIIGQKNCGLKNGSYRPKKMRVKKWKLSIKKIHVIDRKLPVIIQNNASHLSKYLMLSTKKNVNHQSINGLIYQRNSTRW